MPSIVYLLVVVVLGVAAGYIAWYAWQQPRQPGSRVFALFALAISGLMLAELAFLLSASETQALLCFGIRQVFFASIPVLWLIFVLEYSGRSEWLPRRLLIGFAIIPVISQVLIRTNGWHHWWVRQDVRLYREGLVWAADATDRIPGPWFLLQTSYSLLLAVASLVILALTAWRHRWHPVRTALVLSAAAAGVVTGALSAGGRGNYLEVNLLVLGLGGGLLLAALAVFRFGYFRLNDGPDGGERFTDLEAGQKHVLAQFAFGYLVVGLGLATAAISTYQDYQQQYLSQIRAQLSTVATLKTNLLNDWRTEHFDDGRLFFANADYARLVKDFQARPDDAAGQKRLTAWLTPLLLNPEYEGVFLLDPAGGALLTMPATEKPGLPLANEAAAVLAGQRVELLDFHRNPTNGHMHLALLIPVYDPDSGQPLAVTAIQINPAVYLYPLVEAWPTSSVSAEILLVRREGGEVVWINGPRHQSDLALQVRVPVERTAILPVQAVLGQTGIVEGLDDRGAPVLGDVRVIPNSPWWLVTQIAVDEVYAPLRERGWSIVVLLGLVMTAGGAGLAYIWRQQRMSYYRTRLKALTALQASEEKFRLAFWTSPDALTISRVQDGLLVLVNEGFEQMTGYRRADVIGQSTLALNLWKEPRERIAFTAQLRATGEVRNFETIFQTPRGELTGLVSASVLTLNGEPHLLSTIRDISERKRAELALRDSEERFRQSFESANDGMCLLGLDGRFLRVNERMARMFGYSREALEGKSFADVTHPDSLELSVEVMASLRSGEREHLEFEKQYLHRDGHSIWARVSTSRVKIDGSLPAYFITHIQDITERKRTEAALRESEERLRLVIQGTSDGIWDWNLLTGASYLSPRWKAILGYAVDDLADAQASFYGLLHPDDRTRVDAALQQHLEAQVPYQVEIRLRHKDGQYRWLLARGEAVRDAAGRATRMVGSLTDVTARRHAEEELRLHSQILQYMAEGVTLVRVRDEQIVFTNPVFDEMFGYAAGELLGRPMSRLLAPITLAAVTASRAFDGAAQTGAWQGEVPSQHKDGSTFWCWVQVSHFDHPEHGPVWVSVYGDITERKQAQEALLRQEANLRALIENTDGSIWAVDAWYRVIVGNEIFHQDVAAVLGRRLSAGESVLLPQFPEAANAEWKANYDRALAGERFSVEAETRFRSERHYVEYRFSPIVAQAGWVQGVTVFGRDVSERKEAEIALGASNARLEQAVQVAQEMVAAAQSAERLKSEFLANTSHELRTPLTGIIGSLSLVLDGYCDSPAEEQDFLKTAYQSSQSLLALINDLLDLAKLEAGRMEADLRPVDLADVFADLARQNRSQVIRTNLTLTIPDLEPGMIVVQADADKLQRILLNLVNNAIKFTPQGTITVRAERQLAAGYARIHIQDTGIGIALDKQARLFQPFVQAEGSTTRRYGGSGLGLSISRYLAELMGGHLTLYSAGDGMGTTLTLTLSLA